MFSRLSRQLVFNTTPEGMVLSYHPGDTVGDVYDLELSVVTVPT